MPDDYAGNTGTSGTLSVGGTRTATIETVGDTDWFAITLQAGYTYRFDMEAADTGDGTLADPFMRIRDSAGNSLESDDDGSNRNAQISGFTAPYSGIYYVSAGSALISGDTGTYLLTATQTASPVNQAPVVTGSSSVTFETGQTIPAAALFTTATDPDGTVSSITFHDSTAGAGFFALDGSRITSGSVTVSIADLSRVTYVTGSETGTNGIIIEAFDNQGRDSNDLSVTITIQEVSPDPSQYVAPLPGGYTLTQNHGSPSQYLYDNDADFEYHIGEDWANGSQGGPVYAITDGTVIFAGPASGYGSNFVAIQHAPLPDGRIVTSYYGHMASKSVSVGDSVTIGEQIGTVGYEGMGTGPHLHFAIFVGEGAPGVAPGFSQDLDPDITDRFVDPTWFFATYGAQGGGGTGGIGPPDLFVTDVSLDEPSISVGSETTIRYVVGNQGNTDAPSSATGIFISTDSVFDAGDTRIDADSVTVDWGELDNEAETLEELASYSQGTYWLFVVADFDDQIDEGPYEGNNVSAPVQIEILGEPSDLTAQNLVLDSSVWSAGDLIGAGWEIVNSSSTAASRSQSTLYLSTDPVVTTSDLAIISDASTGAMGAGEVNPEGNGSNGADPWMVPDTLAPGTYYLGVIADDLGEVFESDETNNVSNVVVVTVEAADPTPGHLQEGTGSADQLFGSAYDDTLVGFGGNDILYAGRGHDRAVGNAGNDLLYGGPGDDTLNGGAGDDILRGHDGLDGLYGNGGSDALYGGGGNDTLDGGDGNDVLSGLTGADTLIGGAGDDLYFVDSAGDTVTELAGEGTDEVRGSLPNYVVPDNVEVLRIVAGDHAAAGNALDNSIFGSNGNNAMAGLGGNDYLSGWGGSDALSGNAGNDVLVGGAGRDLLAGGAGADRFAFIALSDSTPGPINADVITDFNRVQGDRIQLGAIDAIAGGADDPFAFIGTAAFSGTAGELRYRYSGGDTWVEMDVDGDGVRDMTLVLTGSHALVAGDFIL